MAYSLNGGLAASRWANVSEDSTPSASGTPPSRQYVQSLLNGGLAASRWANETDSGGPSASHDSPSQNNTQREVYGGLNAGISTSSRAINAREVTATNALLQMHNGPSIGSPSSVLANTQLSPDASTGKQVVVANILQQLRSITAIVNAEFQGQGSANTAAAQQYIQYLVDHPECSVAEAIQTGSRMYQTAVAGGGSGGADGDALMVGVPQYPIRSTLPPPITPEEAAKLPPPAFNPPFALTPTVSFVRNFAHLIPLPFHIDQKSDWSFKAWRLIYNKFFDLEEVQYDGPYREHVFPAIPLHCPCGDIHNRDETMPGPNECHHGLEAVLRSSGQTDTMGEWMDFLMKQEVLWHPADRFYCDRILKTRVNNIYELVQKVKVANGWTSSMEPECGICYDSIPVGQRCLMMPCFHMCCGSCMDRLIIRYEEDVRGERDDDGNLIEIKCPFCRNRFSSISRDHSPNEISPNVNGERNGDREDSSDDEGSEEDSQEDSEEDSEEDFEEDSEDERELEAGIAASLANIHELF